MYPCVLRVRAAWNFKHIRRKQRGRNNLKIAILVQTNNYKSEDPTFGSVSRAGTLWLGIP